MKRSLLLFLLIIGFVCTAKAQDDLIVYNSGAEKSLLRSAQSADDLLKLSLLSFLNEDDTQAVLTKFNQDFKQLNLEATAGQKPEKRVKAVYQAIQKTFLKDYEFSVSFSSTLLNGTYQNIDAAILYAYTLEKLNIPYQLKQFPGNVFLIAYPETDKIKLETVDATKGIFIFNDEAKQKDIGDLLKDGYITQSYLNNVGVERAFDDFFYAKPEITFKEAVGLLYFNKGLDDARNGKEKDAYSDICKSEMLFPDKKNAFVKSELMSDIVTTLKYDRIEDWKALTSLANDPNATEDTRKYLHYRFDDLLNTTLLNEGKKDKVDEIFNYLSANVADSTLKSNVTQDYYYTSSHYEYMLSNYTLGFAYAEKAFKVNPDNPTMTSTFVAELVQKFTSQATPKQNIDSLTRYITLYPSLGKNPLVRSTYIFNISFLGSEAYAKDDAKNGEKYLNIMTGQLEAYPNHDDKFNSQFSMIFLSASSYYYRKQAKQKAIAILNQGLKYLPDDENLTRRLQTDTGH